MATEAPKPEAIQEQTPEPPKPQTEMAAPKSARLPVQFDADDPISLYMDTSIFEQLQRVAKMMSSAALVPAHLQGPAKQADCFLVVAQAFRWRMDPFAVAQGTFVTKGKLGYEGKLIAAVINTHKNIEGRLDYEYTGAEGTRDRGVIVSAKLRGEAKVRTIKGTVKGWATENDKWTTQPDQMLAYRGAREWARRHMPEAVLGVNAEEEVRDAILLEPQADGSFSAPRKPGLALVTERLEAEAQAAAPATAEAPAEEEETTEPCKHPKVTPAILANIGPDQSWPCDDCGLSLKGTKVTASTATCSHPDIPPSRLAALAQGKALVCGKCGEELQGEGAPEPATVADMAPKKRRLSE